MLNRRHMLMGGAAFAVAAAISTVPFAGPARSAPLAGVFPVGEEVVAWLKANALALATVEPGSGFQDLEPLRTVIDDARVVSLGEATHGTREFFQLKHRLIEYCVSELDFTVIGFETEYGNTLAVNDYVLGGKGNALDVVTAMGPWCWNTEEVVALVEWVRAWNLAHERKVKFHGLDMQSSAAAALHLLAYLERVAPKLAATSERELAPLVSACTFAEFHRLSEDMQEATVDQIGTVLRAFDDKRERWVEQSSETEWHLARQSAAVLKQFTRWKLIDDAENWEKSYTLRDRAMAANVRGLLEAEGSDAKAVLWAHNAHVQKSTVLHLPAGRFDMRNMGSALEDEFDDDYLAVGFAFNQGGFRAADGDHVVGSAPAGFVDAALAATGMPLLALDLARVPSDGPVSRWMARRPWQRHIGAVFAADEAQYATAADPRDNFDVLLFVETTTASRFNKQPDLGTATVGSGHNEEPTNLALMGCDIIPDGWRATHRSLYPYLMAATDGASPKGGLALRIARAGSPLPWGDGELSQSFPAAPWRERRLVFSAAMRAEAPRIGTGAQLVVQVWPKQKEGAGAAKPILTLQLDGLVRSSDWTRRSIALDIPADAERIQISLVVTGDSAGSFGDLELATVDGRQAVTMRSE